jgi:hypothetical protein
MKLASFTGPCRASYGLAADGGLVDLGARLGSRNSTLRAAIAADALGEIARMVGTTPDFPLAKAGPRVQVRPWSHHRRGSRNTAALS